MDKGLVIKPSAVVRKVERYLELGQNNRHHKVDATQAICSLQSMAVTLEQHSNCLTKRIQLL
ncbi:hypothetical protein GmHk_17G048299 [Glycine max]|nr:hypothetical protein GmHk_17G048299 [Glycine max]